MSKMVQEVFKEMEENLKKNASVFKKASKCCDCGKCGEECPCHPCKDCDACGDMKYASTVKNLTELLSNSSELLDNSGLEKSAAIVLRVLETLVSEVAVRKFAQDMLVSDKLYQELKDLAKHHPDLKRDIKGLILEVGEEGMDPKEMAQDPTEMAFTEMPVSEKDVSLPSPPAVPMVKELEHGPEVDWEESLNEKTLPPSADPHDPDLFDPDLLKAEDFEIDPPAESLVRPVHTSMMMTDGDKDDELSYLLEKYKESKEELDENEVMDAFAQLEAWTKIAEEKEKSEEEDEDFEDEE